ncbi:hypothetical protein [Massilia aerilata]|uniref:Uncharacterized protein n=1 Tax=Massilia aerilata TaxID=453817 RepID=A0ABW0S1E8_9BURK
MSISTVKTWRERLGKPADFPLHGPSDVERAMEAEIAELRAARSAPTDLSKRLRATAAGTFVGWDPAIVTPKLLIDAAEEIERYYRGMLAWKQTAEKKDRDWNEERMSRVNDRIAARAAHAVPADVLTVPLAIMNLGVDQRENDEYKRGHRDARHAAADLVLELADNLAALTKPNIDQKGCAS